MVPSSGDSLKELHVCGRDPKALPHATSEGWALQDAAKFSLARVLPDEALRLDTRYPRPQRCVTNELLSKAMSISGLAGEHYIACGNLIAHQ